MRSPRFHLTVLAWRVATTPKAYRWTVLGLVYLSLCLVVALAQALLTVGAIWLAGPSFPELDALLTQHLPHPATADVAAIWRHVLLGGGLRLGLALGSYQLLRLLRVHWLLGVCNILAQEPEIGTDADWAGALRSAVLVWAWAAPTLVALLMAAVVTAVVLSAAPEAGPVLITHLFTGPGVCA